MTRADGWLAIAVVFVFSPAIAFVVRGIIESFWKGEDDEDRTDE